MVKALEGKFFWEHSRDGDERVPAELEIRKAQRKFRSKNTKDRFDVKIPMDERVNEITDKVRAHIKLTGKMDPFSILKLAVGFVHDVNPTLITRSKRPETFVARHHYQWTCRRHFPDFSIVQIAKQIGKDHSVILHSCKKWREIGDRYLDHVEIVDRVMEKIKCG